MPYRTISELPDSVCGHLPQHAQEIYKEAFNNAWKEYADRHQRRGEESHEEVAHKVAWAAVRKKYSKGGDGDWHAKQPESGAVRTQREVGRAP
ncbi:cation transport regulator [Rhodanobacter sp. FW510-R12]|uniref:ChaB family protein n=1 Tax=unclassified Rhodanobacter TaxID=2621553 RepID=UPI0007A9DD7F|nr:MULTISPECIES: ChaB family protein [unclassified Rhodanobacter]KZC15651.1 cation transport regulator [Rhodanobacter sp. FW104-R8]KZC25691.1 cation transport regulator [Rhodanobacter sp. FW510-T8]KZC32882.1 cation transport regulator [Rhodanobacter sp. FW510-R10]